jgi:hypothetical protein
MFCWWSILLQETIVRAATDEDLGVKPDAIRAETNASGQTHVGEGD